MISKESIEKIFSTARVEEVISDFVNLKKSGSNYKGLSPFVNEKTPSFMISPAKQIWKDFSSGKGGNVVSFLMELEHFSYPEALRYLAKKYNIEIEEDEDFTEEQKEAQLNKESLYQVSEVASEFFRQQLLETEEGVAIGLSYFQEREFREETIKKFELGFSPKTRDAFTKYALEKGYKKEVLEKSGLSIFTENSPKGIDRFRERVIFPIHSYSGRIVGFGGRILQLNAKTAKYLNSPESEIYHKSNILYGLFQAKAQIIKEDNCYLVEGYTDVISLHQNGIENVVASSGTSLTVEQIRLIKRLTNNITILYDGDSAGIKASFRGIDMILEQDMNVRVLLFPDGEDPDSFARNHDVDEIKQFITKNVTDFIRFKTELLQQETENDPIRKAALIREIVGSISLIKNLIQRELYIQECARLMNVSEAVLFKELEQSTQKKIQKEVKEFKQENSALHPVEKENKEKLNFLYKVEGDLLDLLLSYGDFIININYLPEEEPYKITVAEEIINRFKEDQLELTIDFYNSIFSEIKEGLEKGEIRTGDYFVRVEDSETNQFVAEKLLKKYTISENWEKREIYVPPIEQNLSKETRESVLNYKAIKINMMIEEMAKQLSKEDILPEEHTQIMTQIMKLKKLYIHINELRNRII